MVMITRKHAVAKDQTQSAMKKPAEQVTTGTNARATPILPTAHHLPVHKVVGIQPQHQSSFDFWLTIDVDDVHVRALLLCRLHLHCCAVLCRAVLCRAVLCCTVL